MHLNQPLQQYTHDTLSAREAQRLAEFIAFGPIVFQVARVLLNRGILDLLRDSDNGLTVQQVADKTSLPPYGVQVLLEAALTAGIVLINPDTDCYMLSKVGWFLINDPATRVNMDFNHDINYRGFYHLDDAIATGTPAGLKTLGDWPTVYEGLSSLSPEQQHSWFAFDHFYSDNSFDQALDIVFSRPTRALMDVGGNTGRWALRCVQHAPDVQVTIVDLPQQITLMQDNIAGQAGADRINGIGINLLDKGNSLPNDRHYDAIWMSQFLDCFSTDEITSILRRAASVMQDDTRLYIMETLWDRQRFEPASFCLTQISLYFTVIANGNSKMYNTDGLIACITAAGLEVETIHDHLGQGHSIIVCKKKSQQTT